jgi:hypothetical protein
MALATGVVWLLTVLLTGSAATATEQQCFGPGAKYLIFDVVLEERFNSRHSMLNRVLPLLQELGRIDDEPWAQDWVLVLPPFHVKDKSPTPSPDGFFWLDWSMFFDLDALRTLYPRIVEGGKLFQTLRKDHTGDEEYMLELDHVIRLPKSKVSVDPGSDTTGICAAEPGMWRAPRRAKKAVDTHATGKPPPGWGVGTGIPLTAEEETAAAAEEARGSQEERMLFGATASARRMSCMATADFEPPNGKHPVSNFRSRAADRFRLADCVRAFCLVDVRRTRPACWSVNCAPYLGRPATATPALPLPPEDEHKHQNNKQKRRRRWCCWTTPRL